MIPVLSHDLACLLRGDCRRVGDLLPEVSIDAVVCDPPYELGFMGKSWDQSGIVFDPATWTTFLRVLKPGGHLLAFGGTRTAHRITCAIEDAGFEIRDVLMWVYATGFPKSLNVARAIDQYLGIESPVIGTNPNHRASGVEYAGIYAGGNTGAAYRTGPGSPEASKWEGWGTALKPAYEPIILARKPLDGTVAVNVLRHGTGGINVDACRIGSELVGGGGAPFGHSWANGSGLTKRYEPRPSVGRWPANLTLSHDERCVAVGTYVDRKGTAGAGDLHYRGVREAPGYDPDQATSEYDQPLYACVPGCPVRLLDSQVPQSKSRKGKPRKSTQPGEGYGMTHTGAEYTDAGGPSRFFFVAKPSRAERDLGCEHLPPRSGGDATDRVDGSAGLSSPRTGAGRGGGSRNTHPTVKPVTLMRYLCRLVTPPDGVVLDPFCGSGTTGVAALAEGFRFVGADLETDIAVARVTHALEKP